MIICVLLLCFHVIGYGLHLGYCNLSVVEFNSTLFLCVKIRVFVWYSVLLLPCSVSLSYDVFKDLIFICFEDGKTFKKPRRPYEKERLDAELKLVGEYGLRCKRELWRVQYTLSRIRNAARELLTLDEKNPRRIFEGEALLRRMNRYGLLDETQNKLDYVLALTVENFLERRLQTIVFKSGMAKSIHHARVLIRQRHIRVGRQLVNIPSFMVRVESQKHVDFSLTSPFGGGRPGRVKRRNERAGAKKASGGDGDEDDEE